jgi:hypothetical protein
VAFDASKKFHAYLKGDGQSLIGSFAEVCSSVQNADDEAAPVTNSSLVFIAVLRKSDPAIALMFECAFMDAGRTMMSIASAVDGLVCLTSYALMRAMFQPIGGFKPCAVSVQRLRHENLPNTMKTVRIKGRDPVCVMWE